MSSLAKYSLILLLVLFAQSGHAQHVFYGERKSDPAIVELFFDKDGFPYPEWFIPDSTMTKAHGSLFAWFLQNNEAFIRISAKYEFFPEKIDSETIYRLRDSIHAVNLRKINALSAHYPAVAFYIHGYRKAFVKQNQDVTSVEEFALLRENLATYEHSKPLEVNVYWDGMYDCCFSLKQQKNRELYRLFEKAGQNALQAGLGFRRVLNGVESQKIQIVAHSLGCKVAHAALFNYSPYDLATPQQESVKIVYLAPALAASDFYKNYPARTPFEKENYHFLVVYNEKDFVLKKKDPKIGLFGPGVNKYGCTSLGCNKRKDAQKMLLKMKEKYPAADIRLLDKTSMGKVHSLRYYARERVLYEVSDFLDE